MKTMNDFKDTNQNNVTENEVVPVVEDPILPEENIIPEETEGSAETVAETNETADPVGTGETKPPYEFYKENLYEEKSKNKKKPGMWIGLLAGALAGVLLTTTVGSALMFKVGILKLPSFKNIRQEIDDRNQDNSFDFNQLSDGEREAKSVVDIAAEVGPSVVMVTTTSTVNTFFGNSLQQGSGSGIIISADGYIITNNHVVENAQIVKVIQSDGTEYGATVIGADAKTDIAVLKIEPEESLTVAVMGDSDKLQVGEIAIAIGNPLGTQLTGTVTQGVISAVNRTVEASTNTYVNLIQTDAAINQGNSGGALVNGYGEVVGINTVKYAASGVEGIGFAIPINDAMPIVADLIEKGYVSGRPLIGISAIEVTDQLAYVNNLPVGLYVSRVSPGSAAEFGGVREGDVIVKADGVPVRTVDELNELRDKKKVGDAMELSIYRNGKNIEVTIRLLEDNTARAQ